MQAKVQQAHAAMGRKDFIKASDLLLKIAEDEKRALSLVLPLLLQSLRHCEDINPDMTLQYYARLIHLAPEEGIVHNNCGAALFKFGHVADALAAFLRAVENDPELDSARESLQSVLNAIVDRWFFRMINNLPRNHSYAAAIHSAIQKTPSAAVLDIGAGTGLLSMIAAQSGAGRVDAVEVSAPMCDIARSVLTANGLQDRVTLHNAYSTDLSIPSPEMPEKFDIIVTETADAGLLGEGMLPTLRHAAKTFLKEGGQIIPAAATVRAVLVQSAAIREIMQVDLETFDALGLPRPGIEFWFDEAYTCLRLENTEHVVMSDEFTATVVHFGIDQLPEPQRHELVMKQSGPVDAVVVYWTLHLDSSYSVSTGPTTNSCWEQAVFPIRPNLQVSQGDRISLTTAVTDTMLKFEISASDGSNIHRAGNSAFEQLPSSFSPFLRMDESSIRILNNHPRNRIYSDSLRDQIESFRANHSRPPTVLDLSGGWSPLAGVAAQVGAGMVKAVGVLEFSTTSDAKRKNRRRGGGRRGGGGGEGSDSDSDSSSEEEEEDDGDEMKDEEENKEETDVGRGGNGGLDEEKAMEGYDAWLSHCLASPMRNLNNNNNNNHQSLQPLPSSCVLSTTARFPSHSDIVSTLDNNSDPLLLHRPWDIVVLDPIEPSGLLKQGLLFDLLQLRQGGRLMSDAIVLPSRLRVFAQCIESSDLHIDNRIDPAAMLGLNMGNLDAFTVPTLQHLHLPTLKHSPLHSPIETMSIVLTSANVDEIVSISYSERITMTKRGKVDAVLFWFSQEFPLSSSSSSLSTLSSSSCYDVAASIILSNKNIIVEEGQQITLCGRCSGDSISFWIDEEEEE